MMENAQKKTVCIVATNGHSLVNFRGALIKDLIQSGFRVVCISIESDAEMGDAVRAIGAEYYQVAGDRTGIGIFSGFRMIRLYKKAFAEIKPDIVFLYMSKPIAFGGLAAILGKVPHYNILVNGLENAYYRTGPKDFCVRVVMSLFYRIVASRADTVFFQNGDDMRYFKEHHMLTRDNALVVGGSGVDMEHFAKRDLPAEPVVLMTARLLWSKGIREFLEAVSLAKKEAPALKVMLVGGLDHNDEALTEEELNRYIQTADIEYCGFAADVRPYLERCSIFVLPSYHEGTPRSVLEALSVGRPIITTDVPGCRETVVDGKNGFLVPARESKPLADKLVLLAGDAALRAEMAEASYNLCLEKYEVHKVNATMIARMTAHMTEGEEA